MARTGTSESDPRRKMSPRWLRSFSMGWDGLAMLLLSAGWIAATGGLSLLYFLAQVHKSARSAPCTAPPGRRLVLGACLQGEHLSADYLDRLNRVLQLPRDRVLILGGRTNRDSSRSEAAAGRDWLVNRGMDPDLIDLEDISRNTLENLRGARERMGGDELPAILITSRYHLARAGRLADGLGLDHHPCAAEDRLRYGPRMLYRLLLEALFLNWYAVGRTVARTIRHRGMLGRIT